ncbi:GNAT family N-acetyltransferase [Planococcus lenghuensis]|uniref:N-acetyltransferase domain-containing protein n=1 Tax=Planococcus lenghuensis TaxID=2213202 RepID=A0A1Q2L1P7_9BACL|nr:N-acetyltransferase [Planococcus lenghuensis]AQQ54336.1 hypothetical protein B0X71_15340 [Planococcus lenghuensis]
MIRIEKLADCTMADGAEAWNRGFEGYFFDMTTTPEAFEKRLDQEGLAPELSLVVFHGGQPAGLVLNGIRKSGNKKIGWNGGTGVASSLRGSGIGKKLMEQTLAIFKANGVQTATLEAIKENDPAIALYEKVGYRIIDRLQFLHLHGEVEHSMEPARFFRTERTIPEKAGELPFYRSAYPWQTLWQSAKGGEALIAFDETGQPAGYAVFRKAYDETGMHTATVLLQCEADPAIQDACKVIGQLLAETFDGFTGEIKRVAVNIPVTRSADTLKILHDRGFQVTSEQVDMAKEL